MTTLPANAVLVVVDVQKGFDGYNESLHRTTPDLESNIARLLEAWRRTQRPVIFVQHVSRLKDSPLRPNQPGVEIKDEVRPRQGTTWPWPICTGSSPRSWTPRTG